MEMSEDRFHFFFLLNFSLLVWSFAVGFCYEIEAHLEFIVLLAQSRRCWNDCLNHLHPLGWNLIWFLKEQTGIWHSDVLRRPFEAGMETSGVPDHSWMGWNAERRLMGGKWVKEVMAQLVECQLRISFCLVWFFVLGLGSGDVLLLLPLALEDDYHCCWLFQKLCWGGQQLSWKAGRSQYTKLGGQQYLCGIGLLGGDSGKGALILIFSSTDAKLLDAAFSSGIAAKSGILYSSSQFFHKWKLRLS